LWIAREAVKDPKERKPLPVDPLTLLGSSTDSSTKKSSTQPDGTVTMSAADLEALNKIASAAFNTSSLEECQFCGR
jgi:hypothetical protein